MRKFAFVTGEQPMGKGSKKVWFQWASAEVPHAYGMYNTDKGTLASLVISVGDEAKSQLEKNSYIVVSSQQEMLSQAHEALMTHPEERKEALAKIRK
jgi:hypothetical protein